MTWVKSRVRSGTNTQRTAVENRGLLLASGIITGEALTGVLLAIIVVAMPSILPGEFKYGPLLSVIAMTAVVIFLVRSTFNAKHSGDC